VAKETKRDSRDRGEEREKDGEGGGGLGESGGGGVTLFVGVNELAEADSRNPENAARPARPRSAAFPERARVTRDIKLIMRERSALAAAEAKRPALINPQTRRAADIAVPWRKRDSSGASKRLPQRE